MAGLQKRSDIVREYF